MAGAVAVTGTDRRIRVAATVTVVAAAAAAALIAAGMLAGLPPLLVWLPALAAGAAAVVACLGAAHATAGPLRTFWRLMALTMAVVELAAVSQAVDVLTQPPVAGLPPMSKRSLFGYVLGVSVAAAAMLRLPSGHRTWRQKLTVALDVAIVLLAATMAAAQYLRWFTGVHLGLPDTWLNLGMLTIGAVGVVAVVKVMVAGYGPLPRRVLWLGAAAAAMGPLTVPAMILLKPWPHLNGSAAVLPAAGLFFVVAARIQVRHSAGPASHQAASAPALRRFSAVPLVATVLSIALLLAAYVTTGGLSPALMVGAAVLQVLVVARQAVAFADQSLLADRLAHQSAHDTLTGLLNRRAFTAAIGAGSADSDDRRMVLLLDINDFGAINNGLGAATGDALLIAYGEGLRAAVGPGGVVARLGSDEFGVLAPAEGGEALLERVLTAGRRPLDVNGYDVLVETAIGVAIAPAAEADDLFRRAELALRAASAAGGHRAVSYDDHLDRQSGSRARLAAELRRGLDAGEFHLLYQPIVDLADEHMVSVESLIRWTRADGRVISPADFIPVAEESGIIVELGDWVIDTACAQAGAWHRRYGSRAPKVALNVSARQLLDPALPDTVAAALARHGVPADRLTVELTETAVFGGGPALATVRALAQLGVAVALDDFGTGHSSLSLLRTCPVDVLKVDKSFVDGLNGPPEQEAIVAALAGIAATLRLNTVAEGVESAAQAVRLRELGFRHAQGFHFSRPIPAALIDDLIPAGEAEHPARPIAFR
ncbi:MAG: bifunctional diguanylate cyclase/phosphodiesterase [Actinoplanes sp.]